MRSNKTSKSKIKDLIYQITGAAIIVHKHLGPGLLESVYHSCMKSELHSKGIRFQSELIIPLEYREVRLNVNLRCDLFVEELIPVEFKSVERVLAIHEAQILSYMRLLESPKGLIINFNVTNITKDGQRAYVNEFYKNLPE